MPGDESGERARATASRAKTLITSTYERSAADFARLADKLVYSHLAEPLAAALADVEGLVLDVASGTGALARRLPQVVATDISLAQLVHNPVALKATGDAEALPFRTGTFVAAVSAFGINHFPDPGGAVREMARVGSVVGLLTWARPDAPFVPREIVLETVARHAGRSRTEAGDVIEELTDATGSGAALERLLADARLAPEVSETTVNVPWPGTEEFVDYRMSMTGVMSAITDARSVRDEAMAAIEDLDPSELQWAPRLVLGIGRPA